MTSMEDILADCVGRERGGGGGGEGVRGSSMSSISTDGGLGSKGEDSREVMWDTADVGEVMLRDSER